MLQDNTHGRPDIAQYFVAKKRPDQGWDNSLPEIQLAREWHELGTHTLATGRWQNWEILYCLPQKVVTPRPRFFELRWNDGRKVA